MTARIETQRREAEELFLKLPLPGASDGNFLPLEGVRLPERKPQAVPAGCFSPLSEDDEAPGIPDEWRSDKFALHALARWSLGASARITGTPARPLRVERAVEAGAFRSIHSADAGSTGAIVEELTGLGEGETVTGVMELHAKEDARVTYVLFQNLHRESDFFLRVRIVAEAGAEVTILPVFTGGGRGQLRLDTWCRGNGSHVKVRGLARGRGRQQFDFWLNTHHTEPRGRSQTEFRFVMDDASKAVFNGLVEITARAQDTDAGQRCRALLLGPQASVRAVPKLLIATDQVKCGHGASVSTVNPEQIHYLQSRGISRARAEEMIVAGFMGEFLSGLGEPRMAEALGVEPEEEP